MVAMARTARVVFAVALAAAALGEPSPHLVRARAEIAQLRYDLAAESVDRALHEGGNDPAGLVEILRLAGEIAATLGRTESASRFFRMALALDPAIDLSGRASPKIRAPFDAARAGLGGRRLLARREVVPGEAPAVVLLVESDPAEMVAAARAICRAPDGATQEVEVAGSGRIELRLPPADRLEVTVAALDGHGNRLVVFEPVEVTRENTAAALPRPAPLAASPAAAPHAPSPSVVQEQEPPRADRPLFARWWLWGGAAVVAAGVGTAFGLRARAAEEDLDALDAESMEHDFSEAREIDDRGRGSALGANVGFVAAGVFGAVAAVLGVRDGFRF